MPYFMFSVWNVNYEPSATIPRIIYLLEKKHETFLHQIETKSIHCSIRILTLKRLSSAIFFASSWLCDPGQTSHLISLGLCLFFCKMEQTVTNLVNSQSWVSDHVTGMENVMNYISLTVLRWSSFLHCHVYRPGGKKHVGILKTWDKANSSDNLHSLIKTVTH